MSNQSPNGCSARKGTLYLEPKNSDRHPIQAFRLVGGTSDLARVESEDLIREILRRIGENPDREGLQETPARIIRSWKELYGGYRERPEDILRTQFHGEEYGEMVLLRGIGFHSTCEHHLLPFQGEAHVAYLPENKIVGLSKLARLVDIYARRLQVQERLTQQIAAQLHEILQPNGVAVLIEAQHQCMSCRGVRKPGGTMITSAYLGEFRQDRGRRTEFLELVRS